MTRASIRGLLRDLISYYRASLQLRHTQANHGGPHQNLWSTVCAFSTWYQHRLPPADLFLKPMPWIVYEAADALEPSLTTSMKVFEYGSGGSTLWLATRVGELYSVEHDGAWAASVGAALLKRNIGNCRLRHVAADPIQERSKLDPLNPDQYGTTHKPLLGYQLEAYVRTIDDHADDSLDCVIVDGRSRPACIKHAMPKIKKGGFLVLDNSDRETYAEGIELLEGWSRRTFKGFAPYVGAFVSETSIFERAAYY